MTQLKNSTPDWATEFQEFMSVDPVRVPDHVSSKITEFVQRELNPPASLVFLKLSGLQLATGFVTLLFCPQFGVSLTGRAGLMGYLMQYGDAVCMMGCGAFFMAASLLAAALVLSREEIRVIRTHRFGQIGVLASLSLAAFFFTGAASIELASAFWFLGAIVGGLTSLEAGWMVRSWLMKRIVYVS